MFNSPSSLKEQSVQQIEFRLKSVRKSFELIAEAERTEKIQSFYKEVAYFVHNIITDDLHYNYFMYLINYEKHKKQRKEFQENLNLIKSHLIEAGKIITEKYLGNPYFGVTGKFINPFVDLGVARQLLCDAKDILKLATEIDVSIYSNYNLGVIFNELCTMAAGIQTYSTEKAEDLMVVIISLQPLIEKMSFELMFDKEFSGAQAAYNVFQIYQAFNPSSSVSSPTDGRMVAAFIREGNAEAVHPPEGLLFDCDKVANVLIFKLTSLVLKNAIIERFKVYIELYKVKDLKATDDEKFFQGEFEQFLFQNGFFPLSEIQFPNARLDTLVISKENIILYEFKLIRPNSTGRTKVFGSKIQAEKYAGILQALSLQTTEIHIVIFSQKPIQIINSTNFIDKNNLRFNFHIVSLYNGNISQIKETEIESVDLESFFSKKTGKTGFTKSKRAKPKVRVARPVKPKI
jgi:hypothetical protein